MSTDIAVTLPSLNASVETVALTIARLREFVSSSVSDSSLQLMLDAAYQDIDECIGPAGEVSEFFSVNGDLILLSRRAESITAVSENVSHTSTALSADDYTLRPSGRTLVRSYSGTNPRYRWCGRVDVAYRPFDDIATRARVAIELVKLGIAFSPSLASQTIGTWSETYTTGKPYADQRAEILATLNLGIGVY